MTVNTKWWRAHRLAWTEKHGPIPKGMMVLHGCDNPPCKNVDHLYLGDALKNNRDAIAAGRRARFPGDRYYGRGENHGRAKITNAQREEIQLIYSFGLYTQSELGKLYGLAQTRISAIVR